MGVGVRGMWGLGGWMGVGVHTSVCLSVVQTWLWRCERICKRIGPLRIRNAKCLVVVVVVVVVVINGETTGGGRDRSDLYGTPHFTDITGNAMVCVGEPVWGTRIAQPSFTLYLKCRQTKTRRFKTNNKQGQDNRSYITGKTQYHIKIQANKELCRASQGKKKDNKAIKTRDWSGSKQRAKKYAPHHLLMM